MTDPSLVTQIRTPPGTIDLGLGDPPFDLLPLDLLRRAAADAFAHRDPHFLQYGLEQGSLPFRAHLADFLARGYGFPISAESLFVTPGASGGLDLLCTLFTRPGQTVLVEEPSYFLALRIFADHGLQVVSIETDADGLLIEALEAQLKRVHPALVYTIPSFQNPSGRTLPAVRRERLVELAHDHDFLLVADEVYHFLGTTRQPPASFSAYAQEANVVALNSFSKILAPGLRLGWLQANPGLIQQLAGCGLLDSGGGLSPFTSAVVGEVIASGGLEAHINKLQAIYRERLRFMDATLRRALPGAEYALPEGGYFFWARLPGVDTSALRERARARRVDLRPGKLFSSRGGLGEYMRLSFAFYEEEQVEEGLQRLAQCL
ncbi:MAG: PLP-dependent aminotransferase family protein [Anaerolineales bacterium]|nr:PLP-dependent aminotransferase family protein [Anaerolineales bacterium]